jgi:hypothetical protein
MQKKFSQRILFAFPSCGCSLKTQSRIEDFLREYTISNHKTHTAHCFYILKDTFFISRHELIRDTERLTSEEKH